MMEDEKKVTIEIDLASLWTGGEHGSTFAEFVADRAVVKLLSFDAEAISEFRRRARQITDEEIREALKPVLAQALDAAVQRTDTYGTPRGEPQTLREVVVAAGLLELQKPRERPGSGYGRTETLVQAIIREEVERHLATDLREAVQEARGEVIAAVREKGAEVIAETISRLAEGRRV